MLAFFGTGLGPTELIIVGVVAVLLFGSRLPSVARSAGKSLTEFKRGMRDLQDDVRRSIDAEEFADRQQQLTESSQQDPPAEAADEDSGKADPASGSYPEPERTPYESATGS